MKGLNIIRLAVLVMLTALIAMQMASCGWKGEELIEYDPTSGADTATNDLTYTAVTSNVSSVSAVSAYLNGYTNYTTDPLIDFAEYGFLISRFQENPTYASADEGEENTESYVRRIRLDEIAIDCSISYRVMGLIPNTEFFYRTYVKQKDGEILYGIVKHFMTSDIELTIYTPTRTGLADADMSARIDGLNNGDYGGDVFLTFECSDVSFLDTTTTRTYYKSQEASDGESIYLKTTTFTEMTHATTYYAKAFLTVNSKYYVYEEDNVYNTKTQQYTYGVAVEDVTSCKYVTEEIKFETSTLNGVASYNSSDVTLNYDAADIVDCYFVLPSDTLEVQEYGVALILEDEAGNIYYKYYPSDTEELRTGKRYDVNIADLELDTGYSYVAYLIVEGIEFISVDVYTFHTKDYTPYYVDLGLSVLWADRNVGSYAVSHAGCYYSWGETQQKKNYVDETFVGPGTDVTDISGTSYDVATVNWGEPWRIPTVAEVEELFEECEWAWKKQDDMWGYLITGPNDSTIFMPAGGMMNGTELADYGNYGYYWTSERVESNSETEYVVDIRFRSGINAGVGTTPFGSCLPSLGLCVRPVRER